MYCWNLTKSNQSSTQLRKIVSSTKAVQIKWSPLCTAGDLAKPTAAALPLSKKGVCWCGLQLPCRSVSSTGIPLWKLRRIWVSCELLRLQPDCPSLSAALLPSRGRNATGLECLLLCTDSTCPVLSAQQGAGLWHLLHGLWRAVVEAACLHKGSWNN